MERKVYIPQEPTRWNQDINAQVPLYDFSAAKKFGELVVCLQPNLSFYVTKPIAATLREAMANFKEDDFLVAVGPPLLIGMASHIALSNTGGKLNMLTWDRRLRDYINLKIEL